MPKVRKAPDPPEIRKMKLHLITTSEKFGAVSFKIVGLSVERVDAMGTRITKCKTYDECVKVILGSISKLAKESPDLRFVE